MKTFRIYKHVNNTDVAIVPIKSFYVKEKELWKLKVRWIYYKKDGQYTKDMGIDQSITITKEEAKNWIYKGLPDFFIS